MSALSEFPAYTFSRVSHSKTVQFGTGRGMKSGSQYVAQLKKSDALAAGMCGAQSSAYRVMPSLEPHAERAWLKRACHPGKFTRKPLLVINLAFPSLDQATFDKLAEAWRDETGGLSSLSKITSNAHYLRVIGYGSSALPFILRDLQIEPAPWFTALRIITGKNVGREYAGNFQKIAEAWIEWGKVAGLI